MPRTLTPIPIHEDARFVDVGKLSRIIIQRTEYNGQQQVQLATQSPRFGRKPEFADVPDNEVTVDMFNVKHGINLTTSVMAVLAEVINASTKPQVKRARKAE